MKTIFLAGLAMVFALPVMAEDVMDDGSLVVLPLEAQQCNLPSAPPPIPDVPAKSDLLDAQQHVKTFQADLVTYRACINENATNPELSTGNRQAINNAYNYSVDMEERVAAMFNDAVKAYKAAQAGN